MSAKRVPLATNVLLVAALCSCGAAHTHTATISGQVFIVTQGRENVKLGLVSIGLYAERVIRGHLLRRAQAVPGERARLMREADELQRSRIAAAKVGLAQAKARSERLLLAYIHEPGQPRGYAQREAVVAQAEAELRAAERAGDSLRAQLARLPSPAFYLQEMPTPLQETQTDADGRFEFAVPDTTRYVLVAHTERVVPLGGVEKYSWIVPVGADEKRVLLSNNNLLPDDMSSYVFP